MRKILKQLTLSRCETCGSDTPEDRDPIVFCHECMKAYHMACVGLAAFPAGLFTGPCCESRKRKSSEISVSSPLRRKMDPRASALDYSSRLLDERLTKAFAFPRVSKQNILDMHVKVMMRIRREPRLRDVGNFIFIGNSDGQLEAAREFARILHRDEIVFSDLFVRVCSTDFIGRSANFTIHNVKCQLDSAVGGVLFIEDADVIFDRTGRDFRAEIVNCIKQHLMVERPVLFILGGSQERLGHFIQADEFLKTKFPHTVNFGNIGLDEVVEMFFRKFQSKTLGKPQRISASRAEVRQLLEEKLSGRESLSAGVAEKLFDRAEVEMAKRLITRKTQDLQTMVLGDVASAASWLSEN